MRGWLRQQIPSMFYRRLILLMLIAAGAFTLLTVQAARMTTGSEHERHLARARSALQSSELIPTIRGQVLDRHDRVLAMDRPGFDVAVDFSVIVDDWAHERGMAAARRAYRQRWSELDGEQRRAIATEHAQPYHEQVERMWRTLSELGQGDRSEIEQRKNAIRRQVQRERSYLALHWHRQRVAQLRQPIPFPETMQTIEAEVQAHAILRDVPESVRTRIQRYQARARHDEQMKVWEQVELRRPQQRRYPNETMQVELDRSTLPSFIAQDATQTMTVHGLGMHTIGLMRQVWREDVEARPLRTGGRDGQGETDLFGYRDGDSTGRMGIERALESILRGSRGRVLRQLDSQTERRIEPQAGQDVRLTLDIALQARIQALMQPEFGLMQVQPWHLSVPEDPDPDRAAGSPELGDALNGSAVVLEVDSGHVLAAVSKPGFSLAELEQDPASIWRDERDHRAQNRPVARPYDPGSTMKPIVIAAAMAEGLIGPNQTVDCQTYFFEHYRSGFRCWHRQGGHGPIDGKDALARSCNIYFYELADRLGPERMREWFARFGIGERTGAGLGEEIAGMLPATDNLTRNQHIQWGIGQGPVAWTTLQSAAAYAAFAQGGIYIQPTFVAEPEIREPATRARDLGLDPRSLSVIMEGLDAATSEWGGTGGYVLGGGENIFNVEGVTVYGKSGTAQTPAQRIQNEQGQIEVIRRGHHAWMVCLIEPEGADRPTHVVSVVVEHGGSGGRVAGPVVNQIVHALKDAGYF